MNFHFRDCVIVHFGLNTISYSQSSGCLFNGDNSTVPIMYYY